MTFRLYRLPLFLLLATAVMFTACDSDDKPDDDLQRPAEVTVQETTSSNATVQTALGNASVAAAADDLASLGLQIDSSPTAVAIIIPVVNTQGQTLEQSVSVVLADANGNPTSAILTTYGNTNASIISQPVRATRQINHTDNAGNKVTFTFNANGSFSNMARTQAGGSGGFWTAGRFGTIREEINRDNSLINDIRVTQNGVTSTFRQLVQQGLASGKSAGAFLNPGALAALTASLPVIQNQAQSPG